MTKNEIYTFPCKESQGAKPFLHATQKAGRMKNPLGTKGDKVKSFVLLITFSLLMACWGSSTYAAEQSDQPVINPSAAQELQLIKAKLDVTERYQEQFLSIVLWALGAVFAMALGLAAFNWYTSKISYEREIQAIYQESQAKLKELKTELKTEVDASSQRLIDGLSSREASIKESVIKELNKKLDAQASQLAQHRKEILELRYNNTEREAIEAAKNKRYDWSIYKYCDLLNISVTQGSDHYQVGDILDKMSIILNIPEVSLSSDDVTKATGTLRRLPDRYREAAENLIPKVNKAHA